MTNKVLVTGGAGYIGSHACKALAMAGFTPVVYDNLSRGFEWAVKWGPFERGDLLDQPAARGGHPAPQADRGDALRRLRLCRRIGGRPAIYYRNNVVGSLALLDAMRAGGVDRLVFSSSCTTYGVRGAEPIGEDTPQAPVNPYGETKLMVEQVLRDYAAAYGLRAVALRYFNAAGADPDGEIGEAHDPETHLIPLAAGAPRPVAHRSTVFGDDYPTPDGTCIRDYVHVSDLAERPRAGLPDAWTARPAFAPTTSALATASPTWRSLPPLGAARAPRSRSGWVRAAPAIRRSSPQTHARPDANSAGPPA